jgi:hypothetical protein
MTLLFKYYNHKAVADIRQEQWNQGIEKTKPEVIYLSTCPNRNGTKHLTAIATSFYPVSLNIVLQKAPV